MSSLIRYYCRKCNEYFRGGANETCPLCNGKDIVIVALRVKE